MYLVAAAVLVVMFSLGRWSKANIDEDELDRVDQWRARLREANAPKPWWDHHTRGRTVRLLAIEQPMPDRYAPLGEQETDPLPTYVEGIEVGTRYEGRHREGVAIGSSAQLDPVRARQNQSVHVCWMKTTPPLRAPWEIGTAELDLALLGLVDYARSAT